jgi:hypothetical protein
VSEAVVQLRLSARGPGYVQEGQTFVSVCVGTSSLPCRPINQPIQPRHVRGELSVVQEENTSDLLHILAEGQPFDPAINTGSSGK